MAAWPRRRPPWRDWKAGKGASMARPTTARRRRRLLGCVIAPGALTGLLAAAPVARAQALGNVYRQTNLVSDIAGVARLTDRNLVNPWGLAAGPATPAWVADNGTDVATIYPGAVNGSPPAIASLVVHIPAGGAPTRQVFNSRFKRTHLAGSFNDHGVPDGFAPFNIQELGGRLYVAYAKQDADAEDEVAGPSLGFVDVYSTSGQLLRHLIEHGQLNAPWGLVFAPAGFGRFGDALLVGNFGNGRINAYDPASGEFLGRLLHEDGRPIQIDGLWALRFGNGVTGDPSTLLFTAGIDDEAHGLFGALQQTS